MTLKIKFINKISKEENKSLIDIYTKCFTKKNEFTETNLDFKTCNKLLKKFKNSSAVIKDGKKIIGQTWIIPTNKRIMNEFLDHKIKEQEMILKSYKRVTLKDFDCIYIFYSAILKEYRQKGLIFKARKKILNNYLKINKNIVFFAWAYSKAGETLAIKTSEHYKKTLILKK